MEDPHRLSELPPIQSAHLLRRLEGVIFNHCGAVFSDKNTEVLDASLLGMAGELRNMVYHAMRTEEWKEIDDEYQQKTLSRPKLEVLKLPVQQKTLLPLVPERLMLVSWDELCSEFAGCLPETSSEPDVELGLDKDAYSQLPQDSWQTTLFGSEVETVQTELSEWMKNPYLGLTQACRKLRAEVRPLYKPIVNFRNLPGYLLFRDPNKSTAREISYVLWAALAAGDRFRPESEGIQPVLNIPGKIDLLPLLKVDWKNIDFNIHYTCDGSSPYDKIALVLEAIMTGQTPLQHLFRGGYIDNVALIPGPSKYELVPTLQVTLSKDMHGTSNTRYRKLMYESIEKAFRVTVYPNAWVEMLILVESFSKIDEDGEIEED